MFRGEHPIKLPRNGVKPLAGVTGVALLERNRSLVRTTSTKLIQEGWLEHGERLRPRCGPTCYRITRFHRD